MAQEQSFENLNLQGANLEQDNLDINANNLSYPNSKNGTADLNLYRRQDVITGTPPYSQKQTSQPGGYDDQFFKMLGESATRNIMAKQDTKKYSKPMLYDSSAGSSHKARYLAYGQETYDKVGFNPMIDNEALFNAHTSQFDDWVRMATVAAPMYIQGFLAPMKSYVQAFSGDFGADTKEAIDFEEASAIGRSTKGGALGFLTNVQNSVAYSAGVLTQTVLENALIGAVTGTAGGPGGTAIGGAVGGVAGLIRGIAKLPMALGKMTWGGAKMLTNLKNAKNFEAAKDMFVAGSKTTANFFNPLENTTNAFAKNVFSNADNLAGLARASRTAGAFYQDVNLINSALSEGRLEGGFVENETYKQFYDDHFKRFNRAPTSDEQLEYRKRAKLAGFQDTWQNALLINYSNKIAFPNLFRGNFMSQVVRKVGSGYDVILEKGAKGAVDASFKLAQVNIKNGLKSLAKPGTYGKVGLNYFKTNISEGFQEVGQDILADANKKYYVDTYYDKSKESFDYAMSSLWSAMGHQVSAQGFETFASGFLMGGFLRPFNGMVPRYLAQGYQKYWKQRGVNEEGVSNYQVYKTKQEAEGQQLVDTLNKMRANGVDFLNGRAVNYGAQSIIAKRQQSGELNKREVIDSAHLSFVSDAISSIQAGTYDAWLDNFKTFKNLTPEQIEEVWELEKGEGQKALNAMDEGVKRAEQLKKAHEYAKNNISRKKINLQDLKKGSDEYEKAMLNNKALDAGLFSYVFYTSKFQDNLERVNKLYTKMSNFPALKKLTAATAQDLTDPNKLRRSLSMLKTEIDAMDEKVSPAVKEEKERKNEIYYALRNFQAAQKEWFNTFLNRQNIEKTKQELLKENPDLTDNELEEQAIDKISAEFEEKGLNPMDDYKNSFVELLKTLSEDQVDYHKFITELTSKNKNESDIFEDLVDIHYLNVSNKNLVPIVNFLSAPEAFNEHVDKNLQWMTDLYENRNDDHKRIVNQSFETVANRDALQALADQGIYMDLDQFADYMVDQRFLPEFFIDAVNERIITQDSLLYKKYLDELNEALEVKENPPAGRPDNPQEKLDFLIKEKNQQREKELSDAELAFRQDIENEIGIPYEQILENQEGIDGDNAVTLSDAWKFYQKRIKSIDDTYDKAIEALKDKYTVVQETEPSTDAMAKAVEEVKAMLLSDDEYTSTRRNYIIKGKFYERMTSRIRQNYDKYKYDELSTLEDAYDSTIGTEGLTEDSIKDFIKKLKSEEPAGFEDYTYTELEEELRSLMEEPLTKTAPTEDTDAKADIKKDRYYNGPVNRMVKIQKDSENTPITKEEEEEIEAVIEKAKELGWDKNRLFRQLTSMGYSYAFGVNSEGYRNYLEDRLSGKTNIKVTSEYNFFKQLDAELAALEQVPVTPAEKVSTAEAKTLRSIQKELDALNEKIDKLNEQIEEADDAGNKVRGENLRMRRQELYDLLKETAEKGKQAVPEIKSDLKNYVLSYAIENTYENSKANGIYLDNQYKAVFDPGSEGPQFNPKIISQEAYDNLFGENGYITNIKKRADAGEFYVFSTDLIVYADNLKDPEGNPLPPVAGEIDFIFVDREGNKFIVDLKTGNVAKWINYNTFGQKSYDKKIENTLQQVGYANLSQKRSGEEFQIAIFPLEIEYDKTGFITKAGRPSNPTLMLNQKPIGDPKSESFIINLDKNVKFDMPSTEGAKVYMTAMDFMEQYVTGPVAPGKKAKSRVQTVPQDEASIVDAITREIENGNVIKAGVDANLAKTQGTISEASYKYLIGLLNEKMNTNLIESSVLAAPGQQFITINDIFAEKFDGIVSTEVKVNTGDIVTVESVDEANEEIILTTNNGEKFTVKFSEMNDYIVSPEQLDDLSAPTEPTYQPTQTEIDFTAESIVNVDEFLDSSKLRNEATDEADKQSPDEIDNDLFSNLKC